VPKDVGGHEVGSLIVLWIGLPLYRAGACSLAGSNFLLAASTGAHVGTWAVRANEFCREAWHQERFMRAVAIVIGGAVVLLSLVVGSGAPARAADMPSYFKEIVGTEIATPTDISTKNLLQLNTTMFELYGNAAQVFRKNILSEYPVILGLFSGAGGRFILYRPGMPPLDAPQVPLVYQLLKSVGHSTMALAEVVVPLQKAE
jgi:hypothetical protein